MQYYFTTVTRKYFSLSRHLLVNFLRKCFSLSWIFTYYDCANFLWNCHKNILFLLFFQISSNCHLKLFSQMQQENVCVLHELFHEFLLVMILKFFFTRIFFSHMNFSWTFTNINLIVIFFHNGHKELFCLAWFLSWILNNFNEINCLLQLPQDSVVS